MKIGIYKHSKTGKLYRVHFIVTHSETLEDMVVYGSLPDESEQKYWVRPLSMFNEEVEVDGVHVPRFTYLRA